MRTPPTSIDGINGPIVMDSHWFTGRHSMTVGGRPATKKGRRAYQLPATRGGTVEARVRSSFFDIYPTVAIAGVKHRLGPATPVALRVVMLLPIVLVGGGGIGAMLGVGAIFGNAAILRGPMSVPVKILLMLATLGAAALVWLILGVVVHSAV